MVTLQAARNALPGAREERNAMLCQRCKKNQATVTYSGKINGKEFGYSLCPSCYAQMFGSFETVVNTDILTGLFSAAPKKRRACPVCGTTYADFERTGLLGCPSCYDVFKEELIPYIERIQGKTQHVGKVGVDARQQDVTRKRSRLQDELEKAVKEGRYADAGRIYEQISELKKSEGKKD